jgi:lysophospholipase L1-like esterase
MLGTNDLKVEFNRSVDDIAAAIEGLITLIKTKTKSDTDKSAHVILLSPVHLDVFAPHFTKYYVPDYYDHDSAAKSKQLTPALQAVAASTSSIFVDAAEFARAGDDGIHFSLKAHVELAKVLADEVKKLV